MLINSRKNQIYFSGNPQPRILNSSLFILLFKHIFYLLTILNLPKSRNFKLLLKSNLFFDIHSHLHFHFYLSKSYVYYLLKF